MGFIEYSVLVSIGIFLVGFAGFVARWVGRIGTAESKADSANTRAENAAIQVAAMGMRVESITKSLADHKENVAREYVSQTALYNLENRLVDAITALGTRFDNLLGRLATPAHG